MGKEEGGEGGGGGGDAVVSRGKNGRVGGARTVAAAEVDVGAGGDVGLDKLNITWKHGVRFDGRGKVCT
jgi:hypothetical protein